MYMLEKTIREPTFPNHPKNKTNPSFSSTLLDKIYHSIEENERDSSNSMDMKFHRETTTKALANEDEITKANIRRACLIDKWMEKKMMEKVSSKRSHQTRLRHEHDHEQDVMFFSSTSSSSDSSCGGFSSSDTESMYGVKSQSSCFAPPRPKPVKTSVSDTSSDKKQRAQKHRQVHAHDEGLIKSKSRALKIYENIKKAKQPISPGGKLTSFLNSLFTQGNTKKSEDINSERKSKSGQASTCSSVSSFSRSCLSKTSPSLRKDDKRTVRFYPVSVIVGEDSRPCGHKCLYKEEDTSLIPVSVPTAWKIGGSQSFINKKNIDEDVKVTVMEKSKRVEEAAREFLKEYHQSQRKSDLVLRDFPVTKNNVAEEDEDDDDDAESYASSDLFELDHLAVMGDDRYSEELPVYETTHVSTNRAIANGLMI